MFRISALPKLLVILFMFPLLGAQTDCNIGQQLKEAIDQGLGGGGSGGAAKKIYISNLHFLDTQTRSIMNAGDAELINKAVDDGMNKLSTQDARYVINEAGHTVPNNDANAQKLNDIYWDANLTKKDKINKFINDLMTPFNINGLVTGQFTEKKNGEINIRPIVVSRANKSFVTESISVLPSEYKCTDPVNKGKKILCQGTHEKIRDSIIRLLKQL